METSALHEYLSSYQDRRRMLYLILGVIAFSERWMSLAERQRARQQEMAPTIELRIEEINLDPIYFLLGMIAFTSHCRELLSGAARPSSGSGVPSEPSSRVEYDLYSVLH